MKKQLVAAAVFAAAALCAHAQTFTPAPGYIATKLFDTTPGYTIGSMGADSSGALYYTEVEADFLGTAATRLYKRSPGDNYALATELFNYGSKVFTSFAVAYNGTLYFGESSAGTIRAIPTGGGNASILATVAGNYDLKFSGDAAFLSHNPGGFSPDNRVSLLDLSNGTLDLILNTNNGSSADYSGPIEFDGLGALLYGATSFGTLSPGGGLYRFSSAEIAAAVGNGSITLNPPTNQIIAATGSNGYLALGLNATLFGSAGSNLTAYDLGTLGSAPVGTSDFFSGLSFDGVSLFVGVTNGFFDRSAVFAVIPEPSAASLLLLAAIPFGVRRRNRRAAG